MAINNVVSIEDQRTIYELLKSRPLEAYNTVEARQEIEVPSNELNNTDAAILTTLGGKLAHSCKDFEEFSRCWNEQNWPVVKLTPEEQEYLKGGGCGSAVGSVVGYAAGGPLGMKIGTYLGSLFDE